MSRRFHHVRQELRAREPIPQGGQLAGIDISKVKRPRQLLRGLEHHLHGRYQEAGQIYYDLDRWYGPHYEARFLAAILCREALEPRQGISLLLEVVEARPRWTEALYNLGVFYDEVGERHEARKWFERALAVNPDFASAWINLGNMMLGDGKVDDAVVCYDKALALVPNQSEAKVNCAHALLMRGDYLTGWEYYEHRWLTPGFRAKNGLPGSSAPMWAGESLEGKTLVVFGEQGFGDTLIMLRFLPTLRALGAKLVLRAPTRLLEVLRDHAGSDDQVIDDQSTELPPHDCIVPFMSLPYHLKITTETIPGADGFLYPTARGNWEWTADANPMRQHHIGLVWAGSPLHKNDHNRSMSTRLLAPLVRARPEKHWISLQVGPRAVEARELGLDPCLCTTFKDTARWLSGIHLLITVDTATAHLAGAMGVPTWLCIPAVPDMRWPLTGERTPWYDSVRIIRQPTLGDWQSVVTALHRKLS